MQAPSSALSPRTRSTTAGHQASSGARSSAIACAVAELSGERGGIAAIAATDTSAAACGGCAPAGAGCAGGGGAVGAGGLGRDAAGSSVSPGATAPEAIGPRGSPGASSRSLATASGATESTDPPRSSRSIRSSNARSELSVSGWPP